MDKIFAQEAQVRGNTKIIKLASADNAFSERAGGVYAMDENKKIYHSDNGKVFSFSKDLNRHNYDNMFSTQHGAMASTKEGRIVALDGRVYHSFLGNMLGVLKIRQEIKGPEKIRNIGFANRTASVLFEDNSVLLSTYHQSPKDSKELQDTESRLAKAIAGRGKIFPGEKLSKRGLKIKQVLPIESTMGRSYLVVVFEDCCRVSTFGSANGLASKTSFNSPVVRIQAHGRDVITYTQNGEVYITKHLFYGNAKEAKRIRIRKNDKTWIATGRSVLALNKNKLGIYSDTELSFNGTHAEPKEISDGLVFPAKVEQIVARYGERTSLNVLLSTGKVAYVGLD